MDAMQTKLAKLQEEVQEYRASMQTMKDEHEALHIAYESLEKKFRLTEKENTDLVQRLAAIKHKLILIMCRTDIVPEISSIMLFQLSLQCVFCSQRILLYRSIG